MPGTWTRDIRPAMVLLALLTFTTGILYPLTVTATVQLLFPHEASGSLLIVDGKIVGSEWIGQPFDAPQYFWSRPSATGTVGYQAAASAGSNLGPLNPALADAVRDRIARLRAASAPAPHQPVPVDLVTASASGLDPHISPAAAEFQVARVALARGFAEREVLELVQRHVESRTWGILGEPRVNVLRLNRALDAMVAFHP
ncbi:MAG: potassium-transporting ATPase subunit KdpC [Pirellulaceae bacterium]